MVYLVVVYFVITGPWMTLCSGKNGISEWLEQFLRRYVIKSIHVLMHIFFLVIMHILSQSNAHKSQMRVFYVRVLVMQLCQEGRKPTVFALFLSSPWWPDAK